MKRNDTVWRSEELARQFLTGVRGAIPLADTQIAVMLQLLDTGDEGSSQERSSMRSNPATMTSEPRPRCIARRLGVALGLVVLLAAGPGCVHREDALRMGALHEWDIVVGQGASAPARYAAGEFQAVFARAAGVTLPIVEVPQRRAGHVFIGRSAMPHAGAMAIDPDALAPEQFRIRRDGHGIAVSGGSPRATLYGVYSVLEDYLGVRFLTPDHTHVPRLDPNAQLPTIDRTDAPAFEWRCSYFAANLRSPAFAVRMRDNTVHSDDPNLGGSTHVSLVNHTFNEQIPSRTYGREHPEYFAEIGGKRRIRPQGDDWSSEGTQPCLTNPDVLRIVTEHVLREIARKGDRANVSVSQNDNFYYCRCPRCQELNEREGTPMAAQLQFVNRIADTVAASDANVRVGTLAYQHTRRPPTTIHPRDNVEIWLCSFEACVLHPLDDPNCPVNARFERDLRTWSERSKHLYVWNYNINFRDLLLPFPNLLSMGPNLRHLAAAGVKGVFMYGCGGCGGEFSDLRNYVGSRLLWDPKRDTTELVNEFLSLHYRSAAPPLRRYLDLLHERAAVSDRHPCCYGTPYGPIAQYQNMSYDRARAAGLDPVRSNAPDFALDSTIALAALRAFERALELADDDTVRQRVEKASLTAWRLAVEPLWNREDPTDLDPETLARLRPAMRTFLQLCARHGIGAFSHTGLSIEDVTRKARKLYGVGEHEEL